MRGDAEVRCDARKCILTLSCHGPFVIRLTQTRLARLAASFDISCTGHAVVTRISHQPDHSRRLFTGLDLRFMVEPPHLRKRENKMMADVESEDEEKTL